MPRAVATVLLTVYLVGLLNTILVSIAGVIFATILGIYMGALMLYSGSVWPSIIAHTLYDFIALIWLLKIKMPE